MRLTPIVFLDHFISLGGCKVYLQADQFQLKPISQDLTVTLQHYLQEYANFFCDFAVLHGTNHSPLLLIKCDSKGNGNNNISLSQICPSAGSYHLFLLPQQ